MTCAPKITAGRSAAGVVAFVAALVMSGGLYPQSAEALGATLRVGGPGAAASAQVIQCSSAQRKQDRSVTFAAQMSAIPQTQRMMMRIDIQQRLPGQASYHTVSAAGLGTWRSSEAGVKIYKYFKQVTNLSAPGEYRGHVTYRWFAGRGHLLRQSVRHTQPCVQPDTNPKLVLNEIAIAPGASSTEADYRISVGNQGRASAESVELQLVINGVAQTVSLGSTLEPNSNAVLEMLAPRCDPASIVSVQLDPHGRLEEAPGAQLAEQLTCPLS